MSSGMNLIYIGLNLFCNYDAYEQHNTEYIL